MRKNLPPHCSASAAWHSASPVPAYLRASLRVLLRIATLATGTREWKIGWGSL